MLFRSPGTAGNGSSLMPDLSSTGQFVSFVSAASDLVAADAGGYSDAFVRDLAVPATTLVSVTDAGVQADGNTTEASISGDGTVVAFKSAAANIQPADLIHMDIYIRRNWSLPGASTEFVSTHTSNTGSGNSCADPDLSVNGRFVVWQSMSDQLVNGDTGGFRDIFLRDTLGLVTTRISVNTAGDQGDAGSGTPFVGGRPSVTASGSYVAFESSATNLGGGAAGIKDVFRRGPF